MGVIEGDTRSLDYSWFFEGDLHDVSTKFN